MAHEVAIEHAALVDLTTIDGEAMFDSDDYQAIQNRLDFDAAGVLVVNVISPSGGGKATLLGATILASRYRLAITVIADVFDGMENPRENPRRTGPEQRIVPRRAPSSTVAATLNSIDLAAIDILFVKGANDRFGLPWLDFGQHHDVVLLPVPQTGGTPEHRIMMAGAADLVIITKTDLRQGAGDFDGSNAGRHILSFANGVPVLQLSALRGDGLEAWMNWLDDELATCRGTRLSGESGHFEADHA